MNKSLLSKHLAKYISQKMKQKNIRPEKAIFSVSGEHGVSLGNCDGANRFFLQCLFFERNSFLGFIIWKAGCVDCTDWFIGFAAVKEDPRIVLRMYV